MHMQDYKCLTHVARIPGHIRGAYFLSEYSRMLVNYSRNIIMLLIILLLLCRVKYRYDKIRNIAALNSLLEQLDSDDA